jgi:two-component system CheB/CheR fusion protein
MKKLRRSVSKNRAAALKKPQGGKSIPEKRPQPQRATTDASPRLAQAMPIVGFGASAGGLEAFQLLLRALPRDTGMAFVVVQHLEPRHESMLTNLLSRATAMPVHEVREKMRIEPNHVYVIPPTRT